MATADVASPRRGASQQGTVTRRSAAFESPAEEGIIVKGHKEEEKRRVWKEAERQ